MSVELFRQQGRYATNCGGCNVGTFAEVKARVMRLASDGTILLKVPLVRLRRFLSMSSYQEAGGAHDR